MARKPFYLDVRNWGMNQAFLLIERPPNREPLNESDLSALKMTREQAMELVARLNADRDRALRSTGGGSYRVVLKRNETTHMDFSDLPVLSAKSSTDQEDRMRVLSLVSRYTLAFFDRYLQGIQAPLLDHSTPGRFLESVEKFGPAVRPN